MLVQPLTSVYYLRQETKKDRCPATEALQEEFNLDLNFQQLKLKQITQQAVSPQQFLEGSLAEDFNYQGCIT